MKNKAFVLFVLSIALFVISCKEEEDYTGPTTDFGTSEYFSDFLFSKSDTVPLTKTLKYNFNDYALHKESFIKIKLEVASKKKGSDKNIQFYINNQQVIDNEFILNSKESRSGDLLLGLEFLPGYPEGFTYGYFSVSNHSLDVVNNNDLNASTENRIFKWEANYKVIMNPIKKMLMWTGFILIVLSLIWFLIIRNRLHPKFKKGRLQILKPYFGGVSFNKNTKLIVFTNSPKKQKLLSKVFTGTILYEVNSVYKQDIILRPGRKDKIKIKLPVGAQLSPSVINLEKFNSYTITLNNEVIQIQYS
ncbi:MAG: hypothetical protein KBT58_06195 [Bizionia sp.]|nr:hypothetical protein [Bizionia sp.]